MDRGRDGVDSPKLEASCVQRKTEVSFSSQPSQSSFCCVTQIGSGPRPNPLAAKCKGRAWLRRGSAGDQCSSAQPMQLRAALLPRLACWLALCAAVCPTTLTLMVPWPPVPGSGTYHHTSTPGLPSPPGSGRAASGRLLVDCSWTAPPFPTPGCCQLIAQVRPGPHLPSPSFPFERREQERETDDRPPLLVLLAVAPSLPTGRRKRERRAQKRATRHRACGVPNTEPPHPRPSRRPFPSPATPSSVQQSPPVQSSLRLLPGRVTGPTVLFVCLPLSTLVRHCPPLSTARVVTSVVLEPYRHTNQDTPCRLPLFCSSVLPSPGLLPSPPIPPTTPHHTGPFPPGMGHSLCYAPPGLCPVRDRRPD